MTRRYEQSMTSPLGPLRLVASERGLCGVYFEDHGKPQAEPAQHVEQHPMLDLARAQIGEYLEGQREDFELTLAPEGTPFQRQVWAALLDIPHGQTRSYGELAAALGRPTAARAVGLANGRNPLSIVVPCHRVIGHGGSLTGYAGGLERKRWLLAHEGSLPLDPATAVRLRARRS